MISPSPKIFQLFVLIFAIFFQLSCSKDTDLLAEYVPLDSKSNSVDITILAVPNEPIVIEVINSSDNTVITTVTDPAAGSASVNEDNTITYVPDADATGTDTFSYTTETVNPDATVSTSTGNIKVTISSAVASWKAKFDKQFKDVDSARMMELSNSKNKFQDYYYMYYYFDGLLSIWQATGDNKYLDVMFTVVNNTIRDAVPVAFNSSYLGWPADNSYGLDYPKNGSVLFESYYWKGVATLLRMMSQSPQLMSSGKYQADFDKILAFTEKHVWDKWNEKGNGYIYRENVHMTSHWARLGMELFIITGKQKYKTVFDNISFGKMPGQPSNMRGRIRFNPKVPTAYTWDMSWDRNKVEDTWHASDVVVFWILAYENGMYWTRADIDALVVTLDKVVFASKNAPDYAYNVDGSGGFDTARGRLRDWVKLGRYNRALQNRLIKEYQSDNKNSRRYPIQNLANFALNEKILTDGKPVYPENQ
tara:strand:+ start:399 stop:1829 length:1431 start_codon:yes stop_codon:yes gene_type:complete